MKIKIQLKAESEDQALLARDIFDEDAEIRECLASYLSAMFYIKHGKKINLSVTPIYSGYGGYSDPEEYIPPNYAEFSCED